MTTCKTCKDDHEKLPETNLCPACACERCQEGEPTHRIGKGRVCERCHDEHGIRATNEAEARWYEGARL